MALSISVYATASLARVPSHKKSTNRKAQLFLLGFSGHRTLTPAGIVGIARPAPTISQMSNGIWWFRQVLVKNCYVFFIIPLRAYFITPRPLDEMLNSFQLVSLTVTGFLMTQRPLVCKVSHTMLYIQGLYDYVKKILSTYQVDNNIPENIPENLSQCHY